MLMNGCGIENDVSQMVKPQPESAFGSTTMLFQGNRLDLMQKQSALHRPT
jgi:hypothetical protein